MIDTNLDHQKGTKQPNLLLITVDQMRFDCLSIMGHPVVETPNLDALASRGSYLSTLTRLPPVVFPPGLLS